MYTIALYEDGAEIERSANLMPLVEANAVLARIKSVTGKDYRVVQVGS